MFGLLYNLYQYVKKKNERKLTLVVLGLDGAGKTTAINTIRGELDKEVSPTFGFNAQSTEEGKYKIEIFDLGGSKNIRRIWKTYLSEVHGVIYIVDAADPQRFEESGKALEEVLSQAHLHDKAILVLANKQDLPTSASGPEVAVALGLVAHKQNRFNILPCVAKTPTGQQPDARLREGVRWLVSQVDSVFGPLNARVQEEAAVVKAEELRKKKEREETARRMKEERLRRLEEEKMQSAVGASPSHQPNALAALPNQIESPGGKAFGGAAPASAGGAPPMETSSAPAAGGGPLRDFSDLQHPDQGAGISAAVGGATAMAGQSRMALHAAPSGTPPRPPARRDSLGRGDPAESAHASVEMSGAAAQQRPNSASNRSSDNGGRRSGSGTGSFANKVAPEPLSGSLPIGQSHSPLG